MGSTNSMPVVSQVKSAVQLVCGDPRGALETQEKFLHECPGVAQVTSLTEYCVTGDKEKLKETNIRSVKSLSNAVDAIPVFGHVKGGIHAICGDKEGALNAIDRSTRTSCVMGGGMLGFVLGGPFGAVTGGITSGAGYDGIKTGVDSAVSGEYKPHGNIAGVTNAVNNMTPGSCFDAVAGIVGDGVVGQVGADLMNDFNLTSMKTKRDALLETVENDMFSENPTLTVKQSVDYGAAIKEMTVEITTLENKMGIGETVINPKTGLAEAQPLARPKLLFEEKAVPVIMDRAREPSLVEMLRELKSAMEEMGIQCRADFTPIIQALREHMSEKQYQELKENYVEFVACVKRLRRRQILYPIDTEQGKETSKKKRRTADRISVIHWNTGGLLAQVVPWLGFGALIIIWRPDVIMLNELKATDVIVANIAGAFGKKEEEFDSVHPATTIARETRNGKKRKVTMRGSAILYNDRILTLNNSSHKGYIFNENEDFETVSADLAHKDNEKIKYRFISCYLDGKHTKSKRREVARVPQVARVLQELAGDEGDKLKTIIAGDLNVNKIHNKQAFSIYGLFDCMNPHVCTNKATTRSAHSVSFSAIDYVMCRKKVQCDVLVHTPIVPIAASVHFPIPFDVGPDINKNLQGCNGICTYFCAFREVLSAALDYQGPESPLHS